MQLNIAHWDSLNMEEKLVSLDISFCQEASHPSKPPGPQECLMEKPLNFLHPLLERFVVLMSNHTSQNQRVNDARKVLSICAEGKNP